MKFQKTKCPSLSWEWRTGSSTLWTGMAPGGLHITLQFHVCVADRCYAAVKRFGASLFVFWEGMCSLILFLWLDKNPNIRSVSWEGRTGSSTLGMAPWRLQMTLQFHACVSDGCHSAVCRRYGAVKWFGASLFVFWEGMCILVLFCDLIKIQTSVLFLEKDAQVAAL